MSINSVQAKNSIASVDPVFGSRLALERDPCFEADGFILHDERSQSRASAFHPCELPARPHQTVRSRQRLLRLKLSDPESVRQRTNTFGTGLPKASRTRSTSSKSATSTTGPEANIFTGSSLLGAAASTRMSSESATCGVPDVCTSKMNGPTL